MSAVPDEDPRDRIPIRPSGPPLSSDREVVYRKPRGWARRHRELLIGLVVAVVVLVGGTIAVLATVHRGDVPLAVQSADEASQFPTTTAPAPTSASPTPTPSATTSGAAPPSTVTGSVQQIQNGQWTVEVGKNFDVTVVIAPGCDFPAGKSARDVKKGADVTVTGSFANGVLTATKVTLPKKS